MAGHRNIKTLKRKADALPQADRETLTARVQAHLDAEIAAHDRTLYEIRKARALTQQQVAALLHVSQGEVSRIENQSDLFLSTLQGYLEAIGGHLEVVGTFAGESGEEVRVPLAIGELTGRQTREPVPA